MPTEFSTAVGGPSSDKLTLSSIAIASLLLATLASLAAPPWLLSLKTGLVLGLALIGVVAITKLLMELVWRGPKDWMDRALPVLSMVGICYIIAIITARSADDLLHVGLLLLGAAILHNLAGYLLGYWLARLSRLNECDCRTVAFEVGMQNGGMASGLALNALHSLPAALAPAIFGPWMNVSGSMLATYWRNRSVGAEPDMTFAEQQQHQEAGKSRADTSPSPRGTERPS